MKIVVAPDKFKGSLPAAQVAVAVAAGLRSGLARAGRPGAELVTIPVADGGEGTVDAAVAAGFERVPVTAAGPTGDPVRSGYARRGEVAVVELAGVCGLARLPGGRPAPRACSSPLARGCSAQAASWLRPWAEEHCATSPRWTRPGCSRRCASVRSSSRPT